LIRIDHFMPKRRRTGRILSVRSRRGGKDNRQSGRQPYRRHEIHQERLV